MINQENGTSLESNMHSNEICMVDPKNTIGLMINQGEKEKEIVKRRLALYSYNLKAVQRAFSDKKISKMPMLRKIQLKTCEMFNLKTDRAAWRTKLGIYSWFCMHWKTIGKDVPIIISMLNNDASVSTPFPNNLLFVNLPPSFHIIDKF